MFSIQLAAECLLYSNKKMINRYEGSDPASKFSLLMKLVLCTQSPGFNDGSPAFVYNMGHFLFRVESDQKARK